MALDGSKQESTMNRIKSNTKVWAWRSPKTASEFSMALPVQRRMCKLKTYMMPATKPWVPGCLFGLKFCKMENIRAIIIDDELSSLQNLQQKLTAFCPTVTVIATAQKPAEAILLINHHKPDVIFLDIEMPKMSGFRM